jgi:hypothetical protein
MKILGNIVIAAGTALGGKGKSNPFPRFPWSRAKGLVETYRKERKSGGWGHFLPVDAGPHEIFKVERIGAE